MARTHKYEVELTWTGSTDGPIRNYASYSRTYLLKIAGKPTLEISADPMFRGNAALHNPEDLLLGALTGCHMLTYLALCARAKIAVVAYEDEASGTMLFEDGGGRFTEVTLRPCVTVAADTNVEKALSLHERAHRDCFIAASVNFPVRHEAKVLTAKGA